MSNAGDTPNGEASQAQPAGRGVKILVWVMGAGILVMTALLILGLSLGWHKKGKAEPAPDPTETSAAVPDSKGAVVPLEVATAAGARLVGTSLGGKWVALQLTGPAGDEVILVDVASSRVAAHIVLKPGSGSTP